MKQFHLLLALVAPVLVTGATRCHAKSVSERHGTGVFIGRVVYPNGRPAAGVRIVAEMQRRFQWALTRKGLVKRTPGGVYTPEAVRFLNAQSNIVGVSQADGTFRLQGLITAPYNLKVSGNPSRLRWNMTGMPSEWTAPATEGVWARDGQRVHRARAIVLTRGAVIRGKVIDTEGKPITGVHVASYGPHRPHSGDSVAVAVTDAEGKYSMRVPPGKIEIYIAGPWDMVSKVAGQVKITLNGKQPQVKSHFSNMTTVQAVEGKAYSLNYRFMRPGHREATRTLSENSQ